MTDRRPPPQNRPPVDPYDYDAIFAENSASRGPEGPFGWLPSTKKLKRLAVLLVTFVVIAVAATTIAKMFDPSGPRGQQISVRIPSGSSTTAIASILDKNGVVPSALAFRLWAKREGDEQFMAGEYAFHQNSSAGGAIAVLRSGPKQNMDRLVIPEGLRLVQIAERVGRVPNMSGAKFLEVARSGRVRSEFQPAGSTNLEGLLFPDTYLLSASDTEETLLQRMVRLNATNARVAGIDRSVVSIGKSPYETLIIASLIEAEAKVPDDRPKMSQVIENRLFKAMSLQIDAAVLYAIGNPGRPLTNADLKVASPYNTYTNTGLPPAPIGSPGLASIKAALAPTPGPWLYWVLIDQNGASAFSTTLDEHNRNVALARQRGLL